jgi:hypothetical protein
MCEILHGDKIAETLWSIFVSYNTIKQSQLLNQIKNSDIFSIQPGESTNTTNFAQLDYVN